MPERREQTVEALHFFKSGGASQETVNERTVIEGRKQPRTRQRFLVQIFAVRDPVLTEIATVEDVSSNGSRPVTWRLWEPGLHVDLKSPTGTGNLWARARVVYCRAVSGKAFSVGLNLLTQTSDREVRSISSAFKQQK